MAGTPRLCAGCWSVKCAPPNQALQPTARPPLHCGSASEFPQMTTIVDETRIEAPITSASTGGRTVGGKTSGLLELG